MSGTRPWWQGAVIYQIYVRSFCDSNGDGVGDFPGLISKLDYLAALGIDAIWLSPIHPSPNRDWGYDVSDYEGVHPEYGSQRRLRPAPCGGACARPEGDHGRGAGALLRRASLVSRKPERRRQGRLVSCGRRRRTTARRPTTGCRRSRAKPGPITRRGGSTTTTNSCASSRSSTGGSPRRARRRWRCSTHWLKRGVDGFRLDVANAYLHDPALTEQSGCADGGARLRRMGARAEPAISLLRQQLRRRILKCWTRSAAQSIVFRIAS